MTSRRLFVILTTMPVLIVTLAFRSTASGETGMGYNGLSSAALFDNALTTNPKALKVLLSHKLDNDLFTNNIDYPEMKYQLKDPNAVAVMEDLVSCALSKLQKVTYPIYKGDSAPQPRIFKGDLGLCTGQDDWHDHLPTQRCQQLVSACLFARVNALHRHVPISLYLPAGILPPTAFSKSEPPTIETEYRESTNTETDPSTGTPIKDFFNGNSCPKGQNCSWNAGYIGTCVPNQPVQLSSSVLASCNSNSVRICKGIYGCEDHDSGVYPPSALEYSGFIALQPPGSPGSCTFTCPQHGSFGIMFKPTILSMTATHPSDYPAPESNVFAFREAAFFGNLFDANALTRTREMILKGGEIILSEVPSGLSASPALSAPPFLSPSSASLASSSYPPPQPPGPLRQPTPVNPYQHIYACYNLLETYKESKSTQLTKKDGVANLADRVCAMPDAGCFRNQPKKCSDSCGLNGQAYTNCKGQGDDKTSYIPITTYLDDPCSLVGSHQCNVLRAHRAEAPHRQIARHDIPMANYQTTFNNIVSQGYRPIWVDGYEVAGATFFNAVFTLNTLFPPNNSTWVAHHNLTLAGLQAEYKLRVDQGMKLSQVDSYLVGGQVRYAAIFDASSGFAWTAYFNVNQATHNANLTSLKARGYHPVNISVVSPGGVPTFTALYEKANVGTVVALVVTAADYQKVFDANGGAGRRLSYINAFMESGVAKFSAIFDQSNVGSWLGYHGMTSTQYQNEFDANVARDWLTRLVTGYESGGSARFAPLFTEF